MNDPTPVSLDEIEAAAEATDDYPHGSPGPWTVIPEGSVSPPAVWSSAARDFVAADLTTIDAAFIAAADPPTVLALCKALRIAVEGLERAIDGGAYTTRETIEEEAASALAAVRALVDLGEDTDD